MSEMRSPSAWRLTDLKQLALAVAAALCALVMQSCAEPLRYDGNINDPYRNFDRLAEIVGDHYCFFEQKNVDWPALCDSYRARLKPDMNSYELFMVMSELLDELKDGHVNLSTPFAVSYYKKWWSDYPQDFNERTLQEYYLRFGGLQKSGITYCLFLVPDTIGYIRIPSFSVSLSPGTLDYVLSTMHPSKGLIIDVRDNGGGYLNNVPELIGRFISAKMTGGYIRHKTGPGSSDFSKPFPLEYKPASGGHVQYLDRPVVVLANRSCYSAANDYVSAMKQLDQVRVVGARTGGGGGMPFSSELPNGWSIRMSACPINDAHDEITEFGIDPSPGCEVHCTPEEFARGYDAILEFAFSLLKKKP